MLFSRFKQGILTGNWKTCLDDAPGAWLSRSLLAQRERLK